MTRKRNEDLVRLKRVTEAAWLAASQSLRTMAAQERTAAATLNGLAQDRERCMRLLAASKAPETAQILSTTRWMRWSEAERARQNVELARIRAEIAAERDAAKSAFARDQALEKLLKRLRHRERR